MREVEDLLPAVEIFTQNDILLYSQYLNRSPLRGARNCMYIMGNAASDETNFSYNLTFLP